MQDHFRYRMVLIILFYQISSSCVFFDSVSAAHGSVKKESDFGDIVDLGQEVDLQDDFQEVVVNFLVALVLCPVSLKIAS